VTTTKLTQPPTIDDAIAAYGVTLRSVVREAGGSPRLTRSEWAAVGDGEGRLRDLVSDAPFLDAEALCDLVHREVDDLRQVVGSLVLEGFIHPIHALVDRLLRRPDAAARHDRRVLEAEDRMRDQLDRLHAAGADLEAAVRWHLLAANQADR
jgi:hypothetical protein